MKISDFDIYHLPPLMGMFVDYIENECERLLQESPQFTELQREDHELLDEYPFLNMITDSNGVTKVLDLNYALRYPGRRVQRAARPERPSHYRQADGAHHPRDAGPRPGERFLHRLRPRDAGQGAGLRGHRGEAPYLRLRLHPLHHGAGSRRQRNFYRRGPNQSDRCPRGTG